MKEYERIMKKYKGKMEKYEGLMMKLGCGGFAPSSRGQGNLTRTEFLIWPPVLKRKAGLPPKKT